MPYVSAAERRRQRAAETAGQWDQPSMFDGFGHAERTGLGGRDHTVLPPQQPHQQQSHQQASPPPYTEYYEQPVWETPPRGGPPPPVAAVASSPQTSRSPGYPRRHSEQSARPSPPPPVYDRRNGDAFDPNMFGDNAASVARATSAAVIPVHQQQQQQPYGGGRCPQPPQPARLAPMQVSGEPAPASLGWAAQVAPASNGPSASPGRNGGGAGRNHHLHPLEYDGGAPVPDHLTQQAQADPFGATGALEEYYNRTRGPVLVDSDRDALEAFFATDDFAEMFNAKAAKLRGGGPVPHHQTHQHVQTHQHSAPQYAEEMHASPGRPQPVGSPSPSPAQGGAGPERPARTEDELFPLCHRCHNALLDAIPPPAQKSRQRGGGGARGGGPARGGRGARGGRRGLML